jgi:predicted AAA+ superfamily ATPase
MATKTIPDWPRGITFEQVWAGFMEDRESLKETKALLDNVAKDTERFKKENDILIKENNKRFGDLENRFGEIAEHLVAPGIAKRFNELGYKFDSIAPGGEKIMGENDKIKAQVDLVLRNNDYIAAIEVKVKPKIEDVHEHIKRLEILREHWDKRNDKRKLIGGIAGAIFPQNVKTEALDAGLYVIVQSGDTMKMELSGSFIPREFVSV